MVSFVSALLGGVSIAGTAFNNERREDALLAQKYKEAKNMQDEDNAASMARTLVTANASIASTNARLNKPPAGSQLINVPDFSIAGTLYENNSFRLDAPTDKSRLEQLHMGLNAAYKPIIEQYKLLSATNDAGDRMGMTQSQFDKVWTNVNDPLLSQVSRIWRERAEPQLKDGKRPPSAIQLLGKLGKIPQVRDHIRKLNNSRLSPSMQRNIKNYDNVRSRFEDDSTLPETWNMTVDSRLADRPLQSVARKSFGPKAFIAMRNYTNTGEQDALINSVGKIVRERMPNINYTPDQIIDITKEIDFLFQNAKIIPASEFGFVSSVNSNWREYERDDNLKRGETQEGLRGDLRNFVLALDNGADVTSAATARRFVAQTVGTVVELAKTYGVLLVGGDDATDGIETREDKTLSSLLIADLEQGRSRISGPKTVTFTTQTNTLINNVRKQEEALSKLLDGKTVDQLDERALATYNLHMAKVSIAFRYSKYLQGGTGGNAVSNQDYLNTVNALFGNFSADLGQQRLFLKNMAMGLDARLRTDMEEAEDVAKYSITMPVSEGNLKLYDARTAFIKRLGEDRKNQRENLVFGKGDYLSINLFDRTKMYWDQVNNNTRSAVAGDADTGITTDPKVEKNRKFNEFNPAG